jgi:hypothetical protein
VAPPGNQAETDKTNINLQHQEKPVYSPNLRFVDVTLKDVPSFEITHWLTMTLMS